MQVAWTTFLLLHGSPHLTPGCPSGAASLAFEMNPLGTYKGTLLVKDRSLNLRRNCPPLSAEVGLGMNPLGTYKGFT